MEEEKVQTGDLIIYETPKRGVRLDVRFENETAWLTQKQLTRLFGKDQSVISRHINNVFREGELDKKSNMHFLHNAISDKPITLYSLDVIISVGYRIKSKVGTDFRIWANRTLKQYLLRGYVLNDKLLAVMTKTLSSRSLSIC